MYAVIPPKKPIHDSIYRVMCGIVGQIESHTSLFFSHFFDIFPTRRFETTSAASPTSTMARTKKTPKPKDPRLVRDNPIHAKATAVLGGVSQAHRVYGAICKEREVNGVVVQVLQKETNRGRMMNYILGRFEVGPRLVVKELPLSSVVAGESEKYPR